MTINSRLTQTIRAGMPSCYAAGATWFAYLMFATQPSGKSIREFLLEAAFFAIQTVTTTGYGGEFDIKNPAVQIISCISMIAGAATWSVFTAMLANLYLRRG